LLVDTAKPTGKSIQGREKPAGKLRTADVPRQVSRWDEVGQYFEAQYPVQIGVGTGRSANTGTDGGAAADGTGKD